MEKVASYRNLVVWQKAMDLVTHIYQLTNQFPKSEMFSLASQMKRAAVSIPSNIAEGSRRGSRKDYRHFLLTAYGSGSELETQLEIAKRLGFATVESYPLSESTLDEVMRMLNRMVANLASASSTHYSLLTTHS